VHALGAKMVFHWLTETLFSLLCANLGKSPTDGTNSFFSKEDSGVASGKEEYQ
jgi:hypothetical protein